MTDAKIKRINELVSKSKIECLSDEEKEEQANLRKEYIESVKRNLRKQLENIEIVWLI